MPGKYWIAIGAISASVAVAAGAVGTHVLKESLKWPADDLDTYDVAVSYQTVHSLGLLIIGLLMTRGRSRWLTAAATLFALGIVLFSGGIYAWLATENTTFIRVVPFGGSAWILGWVLVACGALTQSSTPGMVGPPRLVAASPCVFGSRRVGPIASLAADWPSPCCFRSSLSLPR